jgi:hypothetical protein
MDLTLAAPEAALRTIHHPVVDRLGAVVARGLAAGRAHSLFP